MAIEAPSGLMGKPKDTESFEAFAADDVTIYIAKEVIENELKEKSFDFYVEGYGKYRFEVLE